MIVYNDMSNDYDNDMPLMILYDNTLMMFNILDVNDNVWLMYGYWIFPLNNDV